MRAALWLTSVTFALALVGCGGDTQSPEHFPTQVTRPLPAARLDCGSSKADSEAALLDVVSVLNGGGAIRPVLADRPEFFALSAQGDPRPNVSVRDDPARAARAVANRGGLPVTISRFTNSEPPSRTTDFGFRGRWNGASRLIGKAAIDCTQGKVVVFNVAVRAR